MSDLNDVIKSALKIKEFYKSSFVTIWKTGKSYSFNFDKQDLGYSIKEYGIKRKVIGVY